MITCVDGVWCLSSQERSHKVPQIHATFRSGLRVNMQHSKWKTVFQKVSVSNERIIYLHGRIFLS